MVFAVFLGSAGESFALPKCEGSPSKWSSSLGWIDECQGTIVYDNGDKYTGGFKKNQPHGKGNWNLSDGGKVEGRFIFGGCDYCTITHTNGNKYEGHVNKDDKYHGRGTLIFANGDKYFGEWKEGKRHGHGIYTYADEHKYVGEYKDDKKHGRGTLTFGPKSKWAGDKYVGEWKEGKRHGQGTYTYANGRVEEGMWEKGKFKYAQKVTPTETAKKPPAPPPKPKVDQQKRLELARRTQEALQVLGLYSGRVDGIIGAKTRAAILGWQRRNGYSAIGEITKPN